MTLSEEVLRLHGGIRTVLVTKAGEDGEWKMIEEAIKPGVKLLEETRETARAQLALGPALMIGAANSIKGRAGELEIVAILYQNVGAVFKALDSSFDRILCVTTEPGSFEETVKAVRKHLTRDNEG